MKHRGVIFLVGFILGAITAFGIAGHFYETGKEVTKKENKVIKIKSYVKTNRIEGE